MTEEEAADLIALRAGGDCGYAHHKDESFLKFATSMIRAIAAAGSSTDRWGDPD